MSLVKNSCVKGRIIEIRDGDCNMVGSDDLSCYSNILDFFLISL